MKKSIKIIIAVIMAACLVSFLPVVGLYISKAPLAYTNADVVNKLQDNKGEYFGFIILGDNHAGFIMDDSAALKIIKSMNRETRFKKLPIDFAAVAGDVAFKGSRWDYIIYNKLRALIRYPVISAMGNHDDAKGSYRLFRKYAGKDEFAFSDRNSYFIITNNINGTVSEEQFAFLEAELVKSLSYKHRFVIMHKPPMSPYQQSWYRPEVVPWSYRFMKLCEKYKVDIVFSGHEHMFREGELGGVKYITSGGGGGVILHPSGDAGGFLHYLVVRVKGDYVDYEIRKISPPVWEYFAYYLWKDLFYFLKGIF